MLRLVEVERRGERAVLYRGREPRRRYLKNQQFGAGPPGELGGRSPPRARHGGPVVREQHPVEVPAVQACSGLTRTTGQGAPRSTQSAVLPSDVPAVAGAVWVHITIRRAFISSAARRSRRLARPCGRPRSGAKRSPQGRARSTRSIGAGLRRDMEDAQGRAHDLGQGLRHRKSRERVFRTIERDR